MKKLFFGFVFGCSAFFSGPAHAVACPALAGNYISTDASATPLSVTQNQCKSVTFDYTTGGEILETTYTTNGVRTQTGVDQGDLVYSTSSFSSDDLNYLFEEVNPTTHASIHSTVQYSIAPNGHLLGLENDYDVKGNLGRTESYDFAPVTP